MWWGHQADSLQSQASLAIHHERHWDGDHLDGVDCPEKGLASMYCVTLRRWLGKWEGIAAQFAGLPAGGRLEATAGGFAIWNRRIHARAASKLSVEVINSLDWMFPKPEGAGVCFNL